MYEQDGIDGLLQSNVVVAHLTTRHGDTVFIPSGWPHLVVTVAGPRDACFITGLLLRDLTNLPVSLYWSKYGPEHLREDSARDARSLQKNKKKSR